MVAHLIAATPKENLHYISMEGEENKEILKEEEIIEDKIFIPNKEDEEIFSKEDLKGHLDSQNQHLNSDQRSSLLNLIYQCIPIFSKNSLKPTVQTKTKAHVHLKEETIPIKLPPYRASPIMASEIKRSVEELLQSKLIQKSTSPWSFPVVVVAKPDGTYRFCVDYSKLTEKTVKDTYPLPRIDDTLDYLKGAEYFSVIDAYSGFWQIPIAEQDKEKLAFCTTFGTYQWNVMPFGFTNAPAIFQRAMNETLDEDLFKHCLVYIDDICIYLKTFDQHLKDIESVFTKLKRFNWKLKLKKCKFAQTKIEYLGHIITKNQIEVHPKNVEKLKQMKRPKNIKDTQAFLGTVNYYRRFIQGLSYLTEPLLINLRGKNNFIWGKEQEEAFLVIVQKLSSEPILKMPDYDKDFMLKTDASFVGFGEALVQTHDGIEHPVSFFSGSFTESQKRWNHWQKEAFAELAGVKR